MVKQVGKTLDKCPEALGENKQGGGKIMKTIIACIMLMLTIALICSPLFVVWYGIAADLTPWGHVLVTTVGLFFCWLVKPVSVLVGKDI